MSIHKMFQNCWNLVVPRELTKMNFSPKRLTIYKVSDMKPLNWKIQVCPTSLISCESHEWLTVPFCHFHSAHNEWIWMKTWLNFYAFEGLCYAGINLNVMQVSIWPVIPSPGHPRAFAQKCVSSPRALAQLKIPEGWAYKWRCPWGRAFAPTGFQIWKLLTGLTIERTECRREPGKVQKTQKAMSNCLFALGP